MEMQIIFTPGMTIEAVERQMIVKTFTFFKSNKTKTAEVLGISIRTLDNKLEKYLKEKQKEEEVLADERNERQRQLERARGVRSPDNIFGHTIPEGPDSSTDSRLQSAVKPAKK